ncbi:exodeoxyribonuclease VII small subunit [Aliifodinibius sp. S!AR15-10]|uniref:exodeoxyribonuclease VII small subunit n=1 Tax=Aliifodinibius sp. S!AR15-10 TaxID=2950437 RepID=UPI002866B18D|nr:exodeoxyribonuclease VII small subunit [Aliifodinibius sp. S!AR15-10]MDR8393481.1 exodeoxyribonuclease VII small subunit [Aliifodinibius sp. S!AR15-10]
MSDKERPSFEDALRRLKEIVSELEDESVSLEDSIKLYEEGIELSKICTETLEEAELRIKKVHEQHNGTKEND